MFPVEIAQRHNIDLLPGFPILASSHRCPSRFLLPRHLSRSSYPHVRENEKHPSAYLGSKQPGKADQVLSKFLECYGSAVGDLPVVGDAEDGAAAAEILQLPEAPPFGTAERSLQEGYSTARYDEHRC